MARSREEEPISRKHIWLYDADVDWVKQHFGKTIGESKAYRMLIRQMRKRIEARALQDAQHPVVTTEDITK